MTILGSLATISIILTGSPAPTLEPPSTDSLTNIMWEYRVEQEDEIERIIHQTLSRYDYEHEIVSVIEESNETVVLPVDDPEVSSDYGPRKKSCSKCSSFHKGTDFTPGYGEPVYAIAAGTVTDVGFNSAGYGRYVYIEHTINGETYVSLYAHLEQWTTSVEVGDTVTAKQQIGTVGSTGISTGPHLHFEVRSADNEFLNPEEFFSEHIENVELLESIYHSH